MRVIELATLGLFLTAFAGCAEPAKQPGQPASLTDKGKPGGGIENSSTRRSAPEAPSSAKAGEPAAGGLQITTSSKAREP